MGSDLGQLLGQIRQLTSAYKAGTKESARAFRDLTAIILAQTVARERAAPRLSYVEANNVWQLGGPAGPTSALPLRDGGFLKTTMVLTLVTEQQDDGTTTRLKVRDSSFQYQLDEHGERWVFRYDYERDAIDRHPRAHLHVRGQLAEPAAMRSSSYTESERIHYPTARVSLEAVIRLLIDQFGVEPATETEVWRRVLAESESAFHDIAHQPLSGPDGLTADEVTKREREKPGRKGRKRSA